MPPEMKILTKFGNTVPFDENKIVKSLLHETELAEKFYGIPPISESQAKIVAAGAVEKLQAMQLDVLTGSLIREVVSTQLLLLGLKHYWNLYSRVGMPVFDAHQIDTGAEGNGDNANLQENAETSHKRKADKISKEQYLRMMPPELAERHLTGDLHIHDLEYFGTRPFCMDHDLRYFFYYGLMPDGLGVKASVAGPAKRAEVAVLHAVKALGSAQTNFAGGQGYYNFLTFIAPYLVDLPYKEIKQLMQMFVYEMTQMMVARGGQIVFSSVQLSPGVPALWKDKPVVAFGKVYDNWTYGELETQVRLAFKALMEVMLEGDAGGKPFNFPKPEISIEPQFLQEDETFNRWKDGGTPSYEELYLMAFDLASKYGTPYFDNQVPAYRGAGEGISCYQCLPEGTLVHIKRGKKVMVIQIEDLQPSDLVLTPDMGYQAFKGILKKPYSGELIEIILETGQSFQCTPDHSVPVMREGEIKSQYVPASEVCLTDQIAVRIEGRWVWVSVEIINTLFGFNGMVYDPIDVTGHVFTIEDGIATGNCCAYQFSKTKESDSLFEDKLYFRDGKHFSMGSWAVVSMNCPRAAYKAGGDDKILLDNLKELMDAAIEIFRVKKKWMDEIIAKGRIPFAMQRPVDPNTGDRGEIAVDFDGLVYTIGVIGINEMIKAHCGASIHDDPKAWKKAVAIMMELKKYALALSEKNGIDIALARTPAETTGQRFAVMDLLHPDYSEPAADNMQGDVVAATKMLDYTQDLPVYYTNGTHVPPNAPVSIGERARLEHIFFPVVDGGNIFHIWLAEERPDPRGLMEMAMNLCKTTQIGYFAFTRDLTIPLHQWTDYVPEV